MGQGAHQQDSEGDKMKATRLTLILTVFIAGAACTVREAGEMRALGPDSSVAVDGGSEDSPVADASVHDRIGL